MDTTAFLRVELAAEVDAGFPRLGRIPQTRIIQFLDYFAASSPGERSQLLDDLAVRAAIRLHPGSAFSFPPAPAWDRYWKTVTAPGPFSGGLRYCDVKSLAMVPRIKEFGGWESWIEKVQRPRVSELALQPREDLLPDLGCLVPARAPELRKLVKSTLLARGFTAVATKGPEQGYVHPSGTPVHVDFGSRMGQLCYWVGDIRSPGALSYELFWGQPGGWDYLTEENAARSIDRLPELIDAVAHLLER
ncbi:MAG TPA: hypothetical protein VGP73_08160 [Thermoanaerobaculia bacterium]